MQSYADQDHRHTTLLKACLLLLSVSLAALELFIPRVPLLPWLKPGLANIVAVAWVVLYGPRDALLYVLIRSWLIGFYFGFSLISLLLGTAGGMCAVLGMSLEIGRASCRERV